MSSDQPSIEFFVSGRLCLFGEHSDWAGEYRRSHAVDVGRTIVIGTEQGLFCRTRPLSERRLIIISTTQDGQRVGPIELDLSGGQSLLDMARQGGFWSYVAGTCHNLCTEHVLPGGLSIDNYCTTLPFKKGLSSSAAASVMVARAFNLVFKLRLSCEGEMQYAYHGERLTPSMCGRMDQCGAYGKVPLLMTFDGDSFAAQKLQLRCPLHLILVDLRASKDTVAILSALQAAYPKPRSPADAALHQLLGSTNERITATAVRLLAEGNAQGLGQLMTDAQSEFDKFAAPLAPQHLTSPKLHTVLKWEPIQRHIWGGKGVGSQGDGTAQLVARGSEDRDAVCTLLEDCLQLSCTQLTLQATSR